MPIAMRKCAWITWIIVAASCHPAGTNGQSSSGSNGDDAGTSAGSDASTFGGDGHLFTDAPSGIPYDTDGPDAYTMQAMTVMNGSSSFNVTVYMPSTSGKHPAVSLSCGTQQTAAGYAPYGERLASYGIAVILTDDPGLLVNTGDIVPNAEYVIDTWLPTMFADSIDTAKIGLAGHSRGGAISLLAAEDLGDKVAAWFGLDPVDNEFYQAPTEYARTTLPNLGIPTTFLGAGVTTNCAPAADSYVTLYPLAPSPSTLIVGLGAAHTELELQSGCTVCDICTPAGTADPNVVLAYAVRYATAFFARELLGDTSVGADFAGAGGPSDVAAMHVTITAK